MNFLLALVGKHYKFGTFFECVDTDYSLTIYIMLRFGRNRRALGASRRMEAKVLDTRQRRVRYRLLGANLDGPFQQRTKANIDEGF